MPQIQSVIESQRNVIRHLGHEPDIVWRVGIDLLAAESDDPNFRWAVVNGSAQVERIFSLFKIACSRP